MTSKQQKHAERWERVIRQECKALREAGSAFVDKNWEAPRVPGSHVPREKSKPDFSGFLSDGRHVVFEAKVTQSKTSFPFSKIEEHQAEHLEAAYRADAVSFLYVLDGEQRRWVVPFEVVVVLERDSFPFNEPPGGGLGLFEQRGKWERRGRSFVWSGENWLQTLRRLGEVEE